MWWYPDRRYIRAVLRPGSGSQYPVGLPIRMVILVQPPGNAQTTVALTPSIVIGFMDVYGNIVSGAGVTVSVTASSGTLSGTTSVQASAAGAVFSNIIFDDITNTILSSRTLTFAASGFSSVVSSAVAVVKGSLQLWLEADYGVVDAAGAALTSWADRSPSGANVTPGATKAGPVYRASGFGGVAGLPYWDFQNVNGMTTQQLAALAQTTFTTFAVIQRDPADANCCIEFALMVDAIAEGIQDSAASAYSARWNAGHTILLESSYNNAGGWIPKGSRQILRHQSDGTHAGHKLFLNGVQQTLPDGFVSSPGLVSTGSLSIRMGYRDPALPALDLLGQYAAKLHFSPMLTAAEAASVESYLQKWMGGTPALPPAPQRGPILLAASVIDGVTITVSSWAASADILSTDTGAFGLHSLVFQFSQPIKRFAATMNAPSGIPAGAYRQMFGVNNYTGFYNWTPTNAVNSFSANGQRVQIDDTATGFTTVIVRDGVVPGSGIPFGDTILQNCRFSIMSDP